ncbi:MAG: threonylcarbamoyl-AMP synthase [Candidatus Kaiserbacteria bacterium]|nr:threonylcarbamoyl-AMP synthase [Candidatus Kaiserbacteria bacterium]
MDIHIFKDNIAGIASSAAITFRAGGVVLFPTDTLYGLGADAFSNGAVDKIYAIKGRREDKPIHALVTDLDMASRFGEMTERIRTLAEALPKGKVTFIVRKKEGLEMGIARGIDTFGFRIPDSELCLAIVREFGAPITATSANKAGEQPLRNIADILAQIGAPASAIDLAIDGGELAPSQPSSVIDLSGDHPRILREGAVPVASIGAAIRAL